MLARCLVRCLTRWLTMFAAATALAAQTAPQPASMSGTVTNSVTGEPVLRAHVTVRCIPPGQQDQKTYGALTNEKGVFSIAPLPLGECSLDAERVGFVSRQVAGSYSLSNGTHKEDLKLTLIPTGAITGRVVNAAGQPVEGVNVYVEMANGGDSGATTDDKGQFRIGGLAPGKYHVKATPESMPLLPPEIRSDGTIELQNAATYYPDSLNAKGSQRLQVRAAAEVSGIDITLVQTPVVQVSGKVTGLPPGVKDLMVTTQPEGQDAHVKADGTFSLWRLTPGKYTLQAQHWGQSMLLSAPLEIEVTTANLEHLELRIVPPFEIAGQLRFDDDQARESPKPPSMPGGTAPPPTPPQPRAVQLIPIAAQNAGGANVIVASDDTFTLERVQPARYRVMVNGVSGYVKSLRAGETKETEGDILDVRNGSAGPVTVTLSSNFCEISGTVSDSNGPVNDAAVVLVPPDESYGTQIARSHAGIYKFRVPPGKYKLAVVDEDAMSQGFQGPEIEDYDPESIDLSAGDKIAKDLVQHK